MGDQQVQGTTAIAGVIGDADRGTFRQSVERFHFGRIEADRLDDGEADRHDVVSPRGNLCIEIRLMLKGIGIEITMLQSFIGDGVIGEGHQLDLQAASGRDLLRHLGNLLLIAAHDTELDRLGGADRADHRQTSEGQAQSDRQRGSEIPS